MRAGRNHADGIEGLAIAHQVFLQRQGTQVGVTAADHRHVPVQADRQSAEIVVENQHAAVSRKILLGHVLEQVLIGGIERLQGFVGLFGLANEVEFGERAG
ncbi:hypothetical protein D3C80_799220 [compost metagenome]